MKLATFDAGNGPRLGAVTPGGMVDLTATGDPILTSMRALIEAGEAGLEAARAAEHAAAAMAPDSARLLAPLPCPAQIRMPCIFMRSVPSMPWWTWWECVLLWAIWSQRASAAIHPQPDGGVSEHTMVCFRCRFQLFWS